MIEKIRRLKKRIKELESEIKRKNANYDKLYYEYQKIANNLISYLKLYGEQREDRPVVFYNHKMEQEDNGIIRETFTIPEVRIQEVMYERRCFDERRLI